MVTSRDSDKDAVTASARPSMSSAEPHHFYELCKREFSAIHQALGAPAVLIVHSAFSKFRHPGKSPELLLRALRDALNSQTTLLFPAFTTSNCHPVTWDDAEDLRAEDIATVCRQMPGFYPERPSEELGILAELFRKNHASHRSSHPMYSWCALGSRAEELCEEAEFSEPYGEESPLGRALHLGSATLLLGCDFDSCSLLHLAERRAFAAEHHKQIQASPIEQDTERKWLSFEMPYPEPSDFLNCGRAIFPQLKSLVRGHLHDSAYLALNNLELLLAATSWLKEHRSFNGLLMGAPLPPNAPLL